VPPKFKNMDELKIYLNTLEKRIEALEEKPYTYRQAIADESKTYTTRLMIRGVVSITFVCLVVGVVFWFINSLGSVK